MSVVSTLSDTRSSRGRERASRPASGGVLPWIFLLLLWAASLALLVLGVSAALSIVS